MIEACAERQRKDERPDRDYKCGTCGVKVYGAFKLCAACALRADQALHERHGL